MIKKRIKKKFKRNIKKYFYIKKLLLERGQLEIIEIIERNFQKQNNNNNRINKEREKRLLLNNDK